MPYPLLDETGDEMGAPNPLAHPTKTGVVPTPLIHRINWGTPVSLLDEMGILLNES